MNILIPLAGATEYGDDQIVPLVEVLNKTLIEYVVENLPFATRARFVFVVKKQDCDKFFIDSILRLVRPDCDVVQVDGPTQGQLCSCLMAIEHIDNDEPLLIVNGNQYLLADVGAIIREFEAAEADGGIITFPNVHPRWSYVKVARDGVTVLQTSEKRPISKHACVGIFYYKHGSDFVEAAKDVIRKRTVVGQSYFVSSTYNSMILAGKRVVSHEVPADVFCGLHTEAGVQEFIASMKETCL